MLNGPALLRVILVVIAAAVLTGLVQHYWIFESSPADAPAAVRPTAPTTPLRRTDPEPVKAPQPSAPPAPAPVAAKPPPEPSPAPASEAPRAALAPSPPPIPAEPQPSPPPPQRPPPPIAVQPDSAEQDIAAAESADPRAIDLVDLNTGSLSELNGLKGGGAIGRAIVQHRPYTAIDQLLSKRVLSRAIYQRIKDQVTVR